MGDTCAHSTYPKAWYAGLSAAALSPVTPSLRSVSASVSRPGWIVVGGGVGFLARLRDGVDGRLLKRVEEFGIILDDVVDLSLRERVIRDDLVVFALCVLPLLFDRFLCGEVWLEGELVGVRFRPFAGQTDGGSLYLGDRLDAFQEIARLHSFEGPVLLLSCSVRNLLGELLEDLVRGEVVAVIHLEDALILEAGGCHREKEVIGLRALLPEEIGVGFLEV